jgi:hypothetical protein
MRGTLTRKANNDREEQKMTYECLQHWVWVRLGIVKVNSAEVGGSLHLGAIRAWK